MTSSPGQASPSAGWMNRRLLVGIFVVIVAIVMPNYFRLATNLSLLPEVVKPQHAASKSKVSLHIRHTGALSSSIINIIYIIYFLLASDMRYANLNTSTFYSYSKPTLLG